MFNSTLRLTPPCGPLRLSKVFTSALATVFLLGFLLGPVATSPANANEALNGTWRIDLERSDEMMPGLKVDNSMTLSADGDNLVVDKIFHAEGESRTVNWTFVTDGKPHEIPGIRQPRTVRAKWKKAKLVVSYSTSRNTPAGNFDLDMTETWKINKKGELEVQYMIRMPGQTMNRYEVYTPESE